VAGFTIKTIEPYEVKDDLKDWYTRASTNPRSTLILGRRAGISAFACAHDEDEITRGVERFAERPHWTNLSGYVPIRLGGGRIHVYGCR